MKAEYLLAGGSMDKNLDAFITGTLDGTTVSKITDELRDIVAQEEPERAKYLMSAILKTACTQDLHERGLFYTHLLTHMYPVFHAVHLQYATSHRVCPYFNSIQNGIMNATQVLLRSS
jgi:hypothetical protein